MTATIYDVARRAGVTAATVSNVIRDKGSVGAETRERARGIGGKLQRIVHVQSLHDRAQRVVAVGTPPEHVEREVDLGRRAHD